VRTFRDEVWRDPHLQRLRVRAEDKGEIAAFHWRGAPDEAAAEAAVREVAARAEAAGLVAHWGRKVLEVRPPVHVDKGAGIARLLRDVELDTALYVGDDTTDLDAFRGLRDLVAQRRLGSALCVGVRSDETPPELEREADLLVDGPAGVRGVLEALL
jgi:trehalose 6-phosphate phosphatase